MQIELDCDLEVIQHYLKNKTDEYDAYEATRFLCYQNRQQEILDLITIHYYTYKGQIDTLMNIEEDSIMFDMTINLWETFKQQITCVKEVLKYLDIKQSLTQYILNILQKLIKFNVEKRLQNVTLKEIKSFRMTTISQQNINQLQPPLQLFDLLNQLPQFRNFEKQFYEQTQDYYQNQYILDSDPSLLIINANQIQQSERQLRSLFSKEFQQKIEDMMQQIVYSQIPFTDLESLYFKVETMKQYSKFATETNNVPKFLSGLRKYIYKEAQQTLQLQIKWIVEQLYQLEQKCLNLFAQIFPESANSTIFVHALEDAINENHERFSYALAEAINPDIQQPFKKYGHMLKYLNEKETFQNYYTKFLIKRMVKSQNPLETELLSQLTLYCGQEWVNDCQLFIQGYNEQGLGQIKNKQKSNLNQIQVQFNLIPKSIWPYQIVQLLLPNTLQSYANNFAKQQQEEQLYQKKKIMFQSKHSSVTLLVKIENTFEIELPLKNAIELLQFNQQKQINQITNYQQYNGLISKNENNQYKINYLFKSNNLNIIIQDEIDIEIEKNQKTISDYLYVVDAAVVKVIKQNKQIAMETLILNTQNLIKKDYPRFIDLCEYDIIDTQINSLLEKEIIKQRHDIYELV